ncbi:uncharacterized protein KQ657_002736 [Scheffersomyces spartinae]|uniref:Small-subunit processome Utp12 domain-containing protein n=1 Tax=Scheffersomyces spartinae TaxID=45513 RepID=A0A9P8AGM3_9ASCO|nr:uncharacterized protein KQ657_002736 [Scheffersomyces spartinae]KAG7191771.1 hypothetical protein KQ657_002736 [Scheffersomyces spartinae]
MKQGTLIFTSDGQRLISPVGNRVSCFDLVQNTSFTFSYEHRRNIACVALNSQETLMLTVDTDGRAILVNFVSRQVLHHFNFGESVTEIKFSPLGEYFAVAAGRFIQVWKVPGLEQDRQFQPFIRHRIYSGHYNDVISVNWSKDSRFFISTSKDMTSKIWSVDLSERDVQFTMAGHRDYVVGAFFNESQDVIYTVSKDGAVFQWEYTVKPGDEEDEDESDSDSDEEMDNGNSEVVKQSKPMSWRITRKDFLHSDAKVQSCCFHSGSHLLVVGLTNGSFRLYDVGTSGSTVGGSDFQLIQQLSMGQNSIDTVSINSSGEWLAFGLSALGQLLVYEWISESYILRQQGHFDTMNKCVYSPDGSRIVTASDDGKIKVWDVASGFCLYTFSEHTSNVTDLVFSKKGNVLFSCSLDGTVRAWDLIRFRNFRVLTAATRVQFTCVAVDPSGEIVVAGSQDLFEVYVWSVQTGQLLDSLQGHEGPISCVSFGAENGVLASSSWDQTVRVWDVFNRGEQVRNEPISVESDVLSLVVRPDGKELAVSTLNGQILGFDIDSTKEKWMIDVKRDIQQGRYLEDRFESKNSARGKNFTTISYSFDGLSLICGGRNNTIAMYDLANQVLLRRFTVSLNMTINGTQQLLNSSRIGQGGESLDLIDRQGEEEEWINRLDNSLPGSHRGGLDERNVRPEIRVNSITYSPTSLSFACASTEGLLLYGVDDSVIFDPYDLDLDVTPELIGELLQEREYLQAIVMAHRLNEWNVLVRVWESISLSDIELVAQGFPVVYLNRMFGFLGELLVKRETHHFEYGLVWIKSLIQWHGKYINQHKAIFSSNVKLLQRWLTRVGKELVSINEKNNYLTTFLQSASTKASESSTQHQQEEEEDVDEDDEEEEGDDDESANDSEFEGWFGAEAKTGIKPFAESEDDSDDDDINIDT